MLFVQHNLLAQNANRQLKVSTDKNAKLTEKLSSGYRINRAADDAAGLSISEKMRRQVRGLHQTVDNISEGVGYVQTAEGALNEVQDMLQRINELAVKAANGTNTVEDRAAIDREVQQLKNEMNRIFSTTTFNERKIWEPGERKLLKYEQVRAVDTAYTSKNMTVTNKNYDVLPGGSVGTSSYGCFYPSYTSLGHSSSTGGYFTLNASEDDGVNVEWTGYNGEKYETKKIDWDKLKEQNYRFEMSTLFDKDKNPELFDGDQPVFTHEIAFSPAPTATIKDIVDSIDGHLISATSYAYMNGSWENVAGDKPSLGLVDQVLFYPAAYASMKNTGDVKDGHDFDAADDDFLEADVQGGTNLIKYPNYSDVGAAKNDSEGWEFAFDMKGIGKVKAASTGVAYWSNDTSKEGEGLWWDLHIHKQNNVEIYRHEQATVRRTDGTLAGVMDALTGDENDATPGLLNKDGNGVNSGRGGIIEINFKMEAENAFEYADSNGSKRSTTDVGLFSLTIPVSATDSEDDILTKIRESLNGNTILDFATANEYADNVNFGNLYPNDKKINAPVYGGICGFYVQAGTESGEHIEVKYEALSTLVLGIEDTNVRTAESAQSAIDEIKGALQMVSEQRSTFGAYQNRIEHARNINENVEENTQAAEALIRDTDVVDAMMEYSINNILMQAGTSMLTQANQSSQSILGLLS